MQQFLQAETLIIELLLVVSLVAIAVRRLRVPYTVALVVVGLFITSQSPLEINLTPELILTLFVPPLVFEAAFHINFAELRRNLPWILMLAVPGVILTMLVVGGIVSWATPLALPIAMVFGALIAATDPVAVVALFRTLGTPKRLGVLVEGESLLNDGTAIVVFNLALIVALTGRFNLLEGVTDFVRVAAGGTAIGLALGWVISRLISRVDDFLIETTLTTVLAFGSYLLAERLHVSGVLAVVAAGLVNGNIGPQGMSPTTRIILFNFWEYLAFLANSLVFLLIGLDVDVRALGNSWQPILWAIAAVLFARILVVYGLGWLANRVADRTPPRWQAVLTWGGLRGAISLALVLSLPASLGADRELLRVMAFGVALFTLIVQGTTMRPLVRWLRLAVRSEAREEYETRHASLAAWRAAESHLDRMHDQGLVSTPTWEKLKPEIARRVGSSTDAMREVVLVKPELEAAEMDTASRELLRARRGALQDLRRDGIISEEVFGKLSAEVDTMLTDEAGLVPGDEELSPQFVEIRLELDSRASGKSVAELSLPHEIVIVSVRRGRELILPRGDTVLHPGDSVTAVCRTGLAERVKEALGPPGDDE
ncbi:MAG TPA: Na+/H+ antiporter [Anaerolineales bacterium]|nr:Na+/H+ antiporter [Anaerolineales bacterium]